LRQPKGGSFFGSFSYSAVKSGLELVNKFLGQFKRNESSDDFKIYFLTKILGGEARDLRDDVYFSNCNYREFQEALLCKSLNQNYVIEFTSFEMEERQEYNLPIEILEGNNYECYHYDEEMNLDCVQIEFNDRNESICDISCEVNVTGSLIFSSELICDVIELKCDDVEDSGENLKFEYLSACGNRVKKIEFLDSVLCGDSDDSTRNDCLAKRCLCNYAKNYKNVYLCRKNQASDNFIQIIVIFESFRLNFFALVSIAVTYYTKIGDLLIKNSVLFNFTDFLRLDYKSRLKSFLRGDRYGKKKFR